MTGVPLEHNIAVTFETTRGEFVVPAALLADDGDAHELRRLFARSLPERDDDATVTTTRRYLKDGSALVMWRRIVVRYLPSDSIPARMY